MHSMSTPDWDICAYASCVAGLVRERPRTSSAVDSLGIAIGLFIGLAAKGAGLRHVAGTGEWRLS
jgi:hypothetical protein